jgi:hypothetical protein
MGDVALQTPGIPLDGMRIPNTMMINDGDWRRDNCGFVMVPDEVRFV